jgi:hypothetical protein
MEGLLLLRVYLSDGFCFMFIRDGNPSHEFSILDGNPSSNMNSAIVRSTKFLVNENNYSLLFYG